MLATASARPWSSLSPLQSLVEQACDPTLPEPNHAVNIELAELINKKKANRQVHLNPPAQIANPRSARETTHALLPHINSRNPNQSLLALTVLDYLVRNCGYPVHLQISTKEFLNELVRRFPERPPMVTGRVMGRILELIHEWKNTLCVHSKHKEDLAHIRDMHRLLSYKGYRFKTFDAARAMASENPNENLKSPEELEEEDRAAKSAKLQELIRRATPRDLAAAQELMKALSGAEPEKATDYASQTYSELDKVQSKAILLNDMLNNAREGERVGLDGDVYDQVAQACQGARPRIQHWIEEDNGEREGMMDRLLLCNDLINNALERFQACKAGDWAKAQALVESANPNKKASDLISFDAFADDEAPLSGDGGLSLPSDPAQSSSTHNPGLSSSGLPLDLFSAPSPAPSPGISAFGGLTSSAPKQDPMAFFRNTPQPPPPASASSFFGGTPAASASAFGGMGQGATGQSGNFGQPMQAQPAGGYSLSTQPRSNRAQQQPQRLAQTSQPIQPAEQAQPRKKDAFADLVDLMG